MIRARSTRLAGSVRDRETSCKCCRCAASLTNAITRRGAAMDPPDPNPYSSYQILHQSEQRRHSFLVQRFRIINMLR
jgi:hypothetical protein